MQSGVLHRILCVASLLHNFMDAASTFAATFILMLDRVHIPPITKDTETDAKKKSRGMTNQLCKPL